MSEQSKSESIAKPYNANSHNGMTFNTSGPQDQDPKTISKLSNASATNTKPIKREWKTKTPIEMESTGKKNHPGSSFGVGKNADMDHGPIEAKSGDDDSEDADSPSIYNLVKDLKQQQNVDKLA